MKEYMGDGRNEIGEWTNSLKVLNQEIEENRFQELPDMKV